MPKRKAPEPDPEAAVPIDDPKQSQRVIKAGRELGRDETGEVVPDDPEQYQRFVEAAQELGADSPEAGAAFERALRRVLSRRASNGRISKGASSRKPK